MTKHILILEPDDSFAERLDRALKRLKAFTVTTVASVTEACLHLMQNPQDLAFIPVTDNLKIIHSLRAIQPDLRLILMTPSAEAQMPVIYLGQVQGVLIKSLVDVELPDVLEAAMNQPFFTARATRAKTTGEATSLDDRVLLATLQRAKLNRLVPSVILARGPKLLAYLGELTETEAATIAIQVSEWREQTTHPSRVQFIHLPARAGDLLLYTHCIAEDYLLTLVALPETPLSELRGRVDRMLAALIKIIRGRTAPLSLAAQETGPLVSGRTSYALVWRPIRPLPAALLIALRRALERLATANACVLTHVLVRAELVHLVVTCPPGRDSVWAAYLFKNGSEQIIQQQFGVAATLWDKGFYAVESAEPLSTAELNIFLEHDS